jgi:hypothetical protein
VPEAQLLAREGLPGLWQQVTSKLGDLKAMILGRLTEFLIPTVLVAGITWIISLLNPASAFVKAVKASIDIVTFIFERGAQLMEFVNSVLDAIIAIAGGGAGGVPALVENALAKSIPVLIGFLAALLGVGGIADKVKEVIQAISRPVTKVVDWVVDRIVGVAKKFWAKLKGAFGGGKEETPEQKQARLDAGLAAATAAVERLSGSRIGLATLSPILAVIKVRYRLQVLEPIVSDGYWVVHGVVNPDDRKPTSKQPAWPKSNANNSNCDSVAKRIQKIIGGDVVTIKPKPPAPRLGPSVNDPSGAWYYHVAVVKDGRVYDAFTGPAGLAPDDFRRQWRYRDAIDFGF